MTRPSLGRRASPAPSGKEEKRRRPCRQTATSAEASLRGTRALHPKRPNAAVRELRSKTIAKKSANKKLVYMNDAPSPLGCC